MMHTLRRSRSSASQCTVPLQKKLVLLGDSNSGKTSLLCRLCRDEFVENDAILTDFNTYEKTVDSCKVRLMLVDTNNHYDRLFPLFCVSTDVALVCFAIDARDSLEQVLHYWKPEVMNKHCENAPIILVGTKADLRDDEDESGRLVTREEALRVADEIGAVSYLECSAKLGDGVREVFDAAVKVVAKAAKASKNDRRKSKCLVS